MNPSVVPSHLTVYPLLFMINFAGFFLSNYFLDISGDTEMNDHVTGRPKIASTISQLLIYNTVSATHHTMTTSTMSHGKDHDTPFSLY